MIFSKYIELYKTKFRPVAQRNSGKPCDSPYDIFLLDFNGKAITNIGKKVG